LVDITLIEGILSFLVFVAAGTSYWRGRDDGIAAGLEGTLEALVKDGSISRFVNKDGDIDFCTGHLLMDTCPKCGFHDGDNCDE